MVDKISRNVQIDLVLEKQRYFLHSLMYDRNWQRQIAEKYVQIYPPRDIIMTKKQYEEEIEFASGGTYEEIWEWASCEEDDVVAMLDSAGLAGQYTLKDLRDMGWEGRPNLQAEIYYLPVCS